MEIGKKIRELRLANSLTQERLSELCGVTAQAVSKWENGVTAPDIALLPELSCILGCTIDELFDLGGERQLDRIDKMLERDWKISDEDFTYAEAVLKSRVTEPRAMTMLADLYNSRGDKYKRLAVDYAKKALEAEPEEKQNHSVLNTASGGALMDWCCVNHAELIEYYRDFTERHPDYASGYLWYMDNLIADGRLGEAREALEKMRKIRDDYRVPLYEAIIAEHAGNITEAERILAEMTDKYGESWFPWSSRADFYARHARYAEAVEFYTEATRRSDPPRYTDNWDSLAQIYRILGDREKAREACENVLKMLKEDWGITEGAYVDKYKELMRN